MKDKFSVYCEYNFWEDFYEKEEKLNSRKERVIWSQMDKFLHNSQLVFDISKEELTPTSRGGKEIFSILQASGGANVRFLPNNYPALNQLIIKNPSYLNAAYLTTKPSEECLDISQHYGVIVLNMEMLWQSEHIFEDNGIPFDNDMNEGKDWSFLQEVGEECPKIRCANSMVIIDPYLFSNPDKSEYNLYLILDQLLPIKLIDGNLFTIAIYTNKNKDQLFPQESHFPEIFNRVNIKLKEIRPQLNYVLTLMTCRDFHDRCILTNNIYFTCGEGFNIFNRDKKLIKPTSTSLIFPFIQSFSRSNQTYLSVIHKLIKVEKRNHNFEIDYWGNRERKNNFVDYYVEPERKINIPKNGFKVGDILPLELLRRR